jgi:hypothetical protein
LPAAATKKKWNNKPNYPNQALNTHSIYQYNSQNLIISYSTAIAATLISIVIGAFATVPNGASHSSSFSAIIATTRVLQLDPLVEGGSLGALPLDQDIRRKQGSPGLADRKRGSLTDNACRDAQVTSPSRDSSRGWMKVNIPYGSWQLIGMGIWFTRRTRREAYTN